jgi:hypothetical protein
MSTAGTPGPMTVDEFYAFTDTRPDDEKWELIGGGADLERRTEQASSENRQECNLCIGKPRA